MRYRQRSPEEFERENAEYEQRYGVTAQYFMENRMKTNFWGNPLLEWASDWGALGWYVLLQEYQRQNKLVKVF